MALYIVQHGKSLSKEADPEQGLSDEGIAGVMRIAEVAEGYRVRVGSIRHSPKVRAVQTAEILDQGPDSHEWFIKWSLMPNIG
jgi:phosphohistidine phosphatase